MEAIKQFFFINCIAHAKLSILKCWYSMGALRKTEVQIHVFFFLLCIVHLCMMEQISFIFFSSNHSFHPENKGFLVIIGSIFDRGTPA